MYLIRLAIKNTLRKTRRSLITALMVLVGVFMIILGGAFLDGLDNSVTRGQIRSDTGHFRIVAKGFLANEEENEGGPYLDNWSDLSQVVGKEGDPVLFPRLTFYGDLSDGRYSLAARGVGIQPESYFSGFDLGIDPKYDASVKHEVPPMWLGYGLVEAFGVKPGDTLTILTRTREGSYNAETFRVAGVARSQNMVIDNSTFFIPLESAQQLLDAEGAITELVGFLSRSSLAEDLPGRLGASLAPRNMDLQTWIQRAEPTLQLNSVRRKILNVVMGILLLVSATGIANTMVMSCFERVKEIGTLRALGLQVETVAALFFFEAALIGLAGSLAGAVAGSAAVYSLRDGLDISQVVSSGSMAVSMSTLLYFELNPVRVLTAVALGLVVTMLATLYPSIRFSRLSAQEAMRR